MGICCCKPSPEPEEDLVTNLPREMTNAILVRLPIKTIIMCKCVCKSWRNLIEGGEFVLPYIPKPYLVFANERKGYTVCDEAFKPLLGFWLPHIPCSDTHLCNKRVVIDSVNGLLLVWHACVNTLFVCNPLTCEYVALPPLPTHSFDSMYGSYTFGFGVSKTSGQYKILCAAHHKPRSRYVCTLYVYTLGGRELWRCIQEVAPVNPQCLVAPFSNGNLHWSTPDLEGNLMMCCVDLETELLTSSFLPFRNKFFTYYKLQILEDRLCLTDTSDHRNLVIWRMNNYRDTNSWVKEYIVPELYRRIFPLKVLAYRKFMFANYKGQILIYSKITNKVEPYSSQRDPFYSDIDLYTPNFALYTPSFLSFTSMGIHNVESLKGKTFSVRS